MKVNSAKLGCLAAALATATTITACGSTKDPEPPSATSSASSTADPNGSSPAAPEVNPAGDIPDNQVYVPYTVPSGLFSVTVPEGWARSPAGTGTLFTDKLNSVRIETVPATAAPTVANATAQELPKIKTGAAGFSGGKVSVVTRKAGQAVLIVYRAESAPNPVTGKSVLDAVERYEFWRGGQEVVLTLSGPVGADNVDPWRIVTDSLRWLK